MHNGIQGYNNGEYKWIICVFHCHLKNHQIHSERLSKKDILDGIKTANEGLFTLDVVVKDQINSYFREERTDEAIRCAGQWSITKILYEVSNKYKCKLI